MSTRSEADAACGRPPYRTLHVVGAPPWIADSFDEALGRGGPDDTDALDQAGSWRITRHELWRSAAQIVSAVDDDPGGALWIAPAALVALDTWRRRHGLHPWQMRGPARGWLSGLPKRLTGRQIIDVTARELRGWSSFPGELGDLPWSQLWGGRVEGFNAARRDISTVRRALEGAPAGTPLTLQGHLTGIAEEWNVVIHRGKAVACSGYCIHMPPDSHHIITIFDMDATRRSRSEHPETTYGRRDTASGAVMHAGEVRFHEAHRDPARRVAEEACALGGLDEANVLVAFRSADEPPVVLEAEASWCSAPYPYPRPQMLRVLDALTVSRCDGVTACGTAACDRMPPDREKDDHTARNYTTSNHTATDMPSGETVFAPNAWMLERYEGLFGGQ